MNQLVQAQEMQQCETKGVGVAQVLVQVQEAQTQTMQQCETEEVDMVQVPIQGGEGSAAEH